MTYKVFDFEKKNRSVIYVDSFALHVHLICVGPNYQRSIRKTHSVIRALVGLCYGITKTRR